MAQLECRETGAQLSQPSSLPTPAFRFRRFALAWRRLPAALSLPPPPCRPAFLFCHHFARCLATPRAFDCLCEAASLLPLPRPPPRPPPPPSPPCPPLLRPQPARRAPASGEDGGVAAHASPVVAGFNRSHLRHPFPRPSFPRHALLALCWDGMRRAWRERLARWRRPLLPPPPLLASRLSLPLPDTCTREDPVAVAPAWVTRLRGIDRGPHSPPPPPPLPPPQPRRVA